MRIKRNSKKKFFTKKHSSLERGFSLMEIVVGIALIAIALLGLAQLFTYSVLNNSRSDKLTNAIFLAQQQIDSLRNLTAQELSNLAGSSLDEEIDTNSDGTIDFRRITDIQASQGFWNIRVLIFSPEQLSVSRSNLLQNPARYRVKAEVSTLICR